MSYPSGTAGDIVESVRILTSAQGAAPIVQTSIHGATCARTGVGLFELTLNLSNQIDDTQRIVKVTDGAEVLARATLRPGGTDRVIPFVTTDMAGAAADFTMLVMVEITRTRN
jgi:hypothetical protein